MPEEVRRDGRLPLTIVGGFLGAGKSTWLRHQLHENTLGSVFLLVNEAAQTPVDNLLLGRADHVEVLAGGCACCEGRAALIAALRRLCSAVDAGEVAGIDRIVLETSGLADPGAIARALADDAMLARRLAIEDTIVLVDGLHAATTLAHEALGRRQIEAAGRIIITRPELVAAGDLARLVRTLMLLNPEATISAAEMGVPVDLPDAGAADPLALPALTDEIAPIRPCRLDVANAGGWAGLSVWLSALLAARADDIVRVKGVVTSEEGRLLLQSVRHVVQAPEVLPPADTTNGPAPDDDVIILIGRGIDEERLRRSWSHFVLDALS